TRKTGLIAVTLREDDELVSIRETDGESSVIIVTAQGKSITFDERDVRPMGRAAAGVKAIELDEGDSVVGMELAVPGTEILVVTESGFGKRSPIGEYRVQTRGGKGILTYDRSKMDRTGLLIGAMTVTEEDQLFLINSDGIIIRINASDVSVLGRSTQGVRIMKVDEGSQIVAMAKAFISEDEDEDEDDEEAEGFEEPADMPEESGSGAQK
ncbi:MAG: DNA gyrase subunit A, partial [Firmicutes bacterium]|nr:DNA gyrase subunit A [Bacillota bacterium]